MTGIWVSTAAESVHGIFCFRFVPKLVLKTRCEVHREAFVLLSLCPLKRLRIVSVSPFTSSLESFGFLHQHAPLVYHLPGGSGTGNTAFLWMCVCACITKRELQFQKQKLFLVSNQFQMNYYFTYASVNLWNCTTSEQGCLHTCVIVCVCIMWWMVEMERISLTLRSRSRVCVWKPSRCRAGCAGRGVVGWWLTESVWIWRSTRTPPPGVAAPSRRRRATRCWSAGTLCLCACRCVGRLGTAWSVLGHPSKALRWTEDTPPPLCGSSPLCSLRPLRPGWEDTLLFRVVAARFQKVLLPLQFCFLSSYVHSGFYDRPRTIYFT